MGKEGDYTPQESADLIVARGHQKNTIGDSFETDIARASQQVDAFVNNTRKLTHSDTASGNRSASEMLNIFADADTSRAIEILHDTHTAMRQGEYEKKMSKAKDNDAKAKIQKQMEDDLASPKETSMLSLHGRVKRDPLRPIEELAHLENALIDKHISAELKLRKIASIDALPQNERQKLKTEAELFADQTLARISHDQQLAALGMQGGNIAKIGAKIIQKISTSEVANLKKNVTAMDDREIASRVTIDQPE